MYIHSRIIQKTAALLSAYVLLLPSLILGFTPAGVGKSLTEEQKVLHVLNRLGFGARPGDVERVKKIGIEKYIEQQLNPASIDDPVAESKLKGLEVVNMSTAEIFEKYPNPGALLRQLEGTKGPQAKAAAANDEPKAPDQMTAAEQRERRQKL